MIDKRRPQHPPGTLPAFTPVPRRHNRHDGWTAERQRGFIEALADTGSVRSAANAVNMTPESAYQLRRHPQAGEFREAWQAAQALGVQRLEDVAIERALHGVEVPVYCFGKVTGTRRVFNDRLLMFILRNRAARRWSKDAVSQAALARHEAALRARWEAERRLQDEAEAEAAAASLNAKLELMRERAMAARALPPTAEPEAEPGADPYQPTQWTPPPPPAPQPPRLPAPFDHPRDDEERVVARWMHTLDTQTLARRAEDEAQRQARAWAWLKAAGDGEEEGG